MPGTRFILDHCGNADLQVKDQTAWKRDIAAVAERKNVVVKISGVIASATPGKWTLDDVAPVVNHTLDVFGPDRVMFGGDWPVCTLAASYRQWFDDTARDRSQPAGSEQRRLFHDNAIRHYPPGMIVDVLAVYFSPARSISEGISPRRTDPRDEHYATAGGASRGSIEPRSGDTQQRGRAAAPGLHFRQKRGAPAGRARARGRRRQTRPRGRSAPRYRMSGLRP